MSNFIEDIIDNDIKAGKVKKVAVRFPPEPNGFLHIGHAKAICLNHAIAKKYDGTFYLRFDDTNPVKEDTRFVDSILFDVNWLVGKPDKVLYASDYFEQMYQAAVLLINKGLAFVDTGAAETIKLERGTLTEKGVESKDRNRSIDENLMLFLKMKNGEIEKGGAVLRAKIDMKSPNINMRDPVIYRVLKQDHHRTGGAWKIYPMYDFAHPLEDAIEGITHSCCSLEFENHRPLYNWVVENTKEIFSKKGASTIPPRQIEFARLNIKNTLMSKRYLKQLVDDSLVDGWDDPRMPTLSGLRRRGYTASAIKEFCAITGVSKADSIVDIAQLESVIRQELNNSADRAIAVIDPLEVVITNRKDNFTEKVEFSYTVLGKEEKRELNFSNKIYIEKEDFQEQQTEGFFRLYKGGVVRLKGAYIVRCTDFERGLDGKVKKVFCEAIEGTKSGEVTNKEAKAKGVIHWLDVKTAEKAEFRLYDGFLVDGLKVHHGYIEPMLKEQIKIKNYQFLRLGYFIKDIKEKHLVFNQTVSLKESK